jgi:hypothetical protein
VCFFLPSRNIHAYSCMRTKKYPVTEIFPYIILHNYDAQNHGTHLHAYSSRKVELIYTKTELSNLCIGNYLLESNVATPLLIRIKPERLLDTICNKSWPITGYIIQHHQYLTDNVSVISIKREICQFNETRESCIFQ